MTFHMASKHRPRISVQGTNQISLDKLLKNLSCEKFKLSSMFHGFKHQWTRHMSEELKQANTCRGNLFEHVISSVYITSTRQIPIKSLQHYGTSISTLAKPETEIQSPVNRRISRNVRGRRGYELAFYIFWISAVHVGSGHYHASRETYLASCKQAMWWLLRIIRIRCDTNTYR